MKRGRNAYRRETLGSDRKELKVKDGRYTVVRFNSIDGEQKWTLRNGDVPLFDNIGTIPDIDSVVVGEANGSLYLVRASSRPQLLCRFKSYKSYESDNFVWVTGGGGSRECLIQSKGRYLIHIPSGAFCECNTPPRMTSFEDTFELDDRIIRWDGSGFSTEKVDKSPSKVQKTEEDVADMRKEELENFLSENIDLDIIRESDNMDEVNKSETPRPIAREFYEMGEGEYPENPDGDFKPPRQDDFALALYHKFKEMSDSDHFREETRQSWIRRFKNAWASLVRDVHFSFMMQKEQKETECFDEAEFDVEKDIQEGVDFIAKQDGVEYHINLFIDSSQSRKFLNKKKKYRHPENDAVAVEVPMKLWGDQKTSIDTEGEELWLYSEEHIDAVKRVILDGEKKIQEDGNTLAKRVGQYRD